jgi:hypothetical protein
LAYAKTIRRSHAISSAQDFIIHLMEGQEMKEQTSIRLIRLARSRPAKYLLQKTSAVIGRNPQKNFPRLIDLFPLFKAYQKRQPFSENLYRACPIIDVPRALRDIVQESGAYGTCDGAKDVFTPEVASGLDNLALRWKETSDPLWQARHSSFRPEPIPEPVERAEELAEAAA